MYNKNEYKDKVFGVTDREKYTPPKPTHNVVIATINEMDYIKNDNWDSLAIGIQTVISKFGLKYNVDIVKGSQQCVFKLSNRKAKDMCYAPAVEISSIKDREWSEVCNAMTNALNQAGVSGTVGYKVKGKFIEFYV